MALQLKVNGRVRSVVSLPDTPLLWVLRDELRLTGTKYSCGIAQCGACMVHIDGEAVPSCQTPLEAVGDAHVTTIEGVAPDHPVVRSWIRHGVPQCGYCQSGQIMSAIALLAANPHPDDVAISDGMNRNLCRCGTYLRIRAAIKDVASLDPDAGAVGEAK